MKQPTTSARRPGKVTHPHLAIIRNLIMSEVDDFVATLEGPDSPGTPGQIHRALRQRIDNAIDYYRHTYYPQTNRKAP